MLYLDGWDCSNVGFLEKEGKDPTDPSADATSSLESEEGFTLLPPPPSGRPTAPTDPEAELDLSTKP